jgi:plastocyanin
MRSIGIAIALWVTIGSLGMGSAGAHDVWLLDDCDPNDPGWAATGGCTLREGDVTVAEFTEEVQSRALSAAVIGHLAWWNDPPYLKIEVGDTVRVKNKGGRLHTFTKVADFGGGRVANPDLNFGLTPAPECLDSSDTDVPPDATLKVKNLDVGNHRFQCCIHPWMRTLIRVLPDD